MGENMKYIFVCNKNAGQRQATSLIRDQIQKLSNKIEYELYETKAPLDATRFVTEYCDAHKDEEIRVARRMGLEATVNNARQAVANIPVSKDKTKGIRESRTLESESNLENNSIQSRLQNETKAIESKSNDLLIDTSKQQKTEEKVKNEYDLENETSIENILKQINNEMW